MQIRFPCRLKWNADDHKPRSESCRKPNGGSASDFGSETACGCQRASTTIRGGRTALSSCVTEASQLSASPGEARISHAALLTAAQLVRGILRLFFVVAVARVLGPGRFGVYALLLAMVEMLAVASGSGYADYLTREAAKDARVGWGMGSQLIWLR